MAEQFVSLDRETPASTSRPCRTTAPSSPTPGRSFQRALAHAPVALLQLNALRRREIERRKAKAENRPALDLGAATGLLGRDASQARAYSRVAEGNGYFWEVLLEFRVPFGMRAEKARYSRAVTLLERERRSSAGGLPRAAGRGILGGRRRQVAEVKEQR